MSETVIIAPTAGTPVQTPPPAPDRLADVHAVIAELEAGKGPVAAPEAPAAPPPATSPAKTGEPAKSETPPKETAAPAAPAPETTPPATPAKVPYTAEEFAAFEGNYHRRDFDWDRWPESLKEAKEFARSVAVGYGKRHSTLREELQRELGAPPKPPQTVATPTPPQTETELTPEQMADAQELLVTPGKFFEGFKVLLGTKQGRELLTSAGFIDPDVREIVDERIADRNITRAITNIAEDFPAYLADEAYRKEVGAIFDETPLLTAKVQSRDESEVTWAFAVANAIATSRRLSQRETAFATREKAVADREKAITAKEQELQRQIEATNRQEPISPATGAQASGAGAGLKPSRIDEAREAMAAAGMRVA